MKLPIFHREAEVISALRVLLFAQEGKKVIGLFGVGLRADDVIDPFLVQ